MVGHGARQFRREESEVFSGGGEFEIRMNFPVAWRRAILAGGKLNEVSIGGYDAVRQDEFSGLVEIVGKGPALDVDRAFPEIVKFDPVGGFFVFVEEAVSVGCHEFIYTDGAVACLRVDQIEPVVCSEPVRGAGKIDNGMTRGPAQRKFSGLGEFKAEKVWSSAIAGDGGGWGDDCDKVGVVYVCDIFRKDK